MSTRVEAAMAALGESYGEDAHCREVEYVQTTLAAADEIMFSEAAIERAAKALRAEFSVDDQVGEYDATAVWGTPADIARAVVAALREGA